MKMEKKILTLKSVRSRWTTLNGQGWDSPKEIKSQMSDIKDKIFVDILISKLNKDEELMMCSYNYINFFILCYLFSKTRCKLTGIEF